MLFHNEGGRSGVAEIVGYRRRSLTSSHDFCRDSMTAINRRNGLAEPTPQRKHGIIRFLIGSQACFRNWRLTFDPGA